MSKLENTLFRLFFFSRFITIILNNFRKCVEKSGQLKNSYSPMIDYYSITHRLSLWLIIRFIFSIEFWWWAWCVRPWHFKKYWLNIISNTEIVNTIWFYIQFHILNVINIISAEFRVNSYMRKYVIFLDLSIFILDIIWFDFVQRELNNHSVFYHQTVLIRQPLQ